jgi:hypothetical protein
VRSERVTFVSGVFAAESFGPRMSSVVTVVVPYVNVAVPVAEPDVNVIVSVVPTVPTSVSV